MAIGPNPNPGLGFPEPDGGLTDPPHRAGPATESGVSKGRVSLTPMAAATPRPVSCLLKGIPMHGLSPKQLAAGPAHILVFG